MVGNKLLYYIKLLTVGDKVLYYVNNKEFHIIQGRI
jgi:hypothetical protein